jgi:hypothetical protein
MSAKNEPTWCRHYQSPTFNKECRAGVNYDALPLNFNTSPCFFSNRANAAQCAKCDYPTPEEVEKDEKEIGEHIAKIMEAVALIDATGKDAGFIHCPKCAGEMRFSVAPNGHRRAACSTDNCIRFIE